MNELRSLEYWRTVIPVAANEDEWVVMAAQMLGSMATDLPESVNDATNAARVMFAAAPESVIRAATERNLEMISRAHAADEDAQRGISDIESFLEWQANGAG